MSSIAFDLDLVLKSRQEKRILGKSVGTLISNPIQNRCLSIPVLYNPFETKEIEPFLPKATLNRLVGYDLYEYKILKQIVAKGFYLSSGSKFGCNYLVYKGSFEIIRKNLQD